MMDEVAPVLETEDPLRNLNGQEVKKRGRQRRTADPSLGTGTGEVSSRKPRTSKVDKECERIRDGLGALFVSIGGGMMFVPPLAVDGTIIVEKHAAVVDALVEIARGNDRVRTVLLRLSETTAFGQLILALAGMIVPIAANHGAPIPLAALTMFGLSDDTLDAIRLNRTP